jgi:hypothetical protein
LSISRTGANATISWDADGTLQSADKVEGPYKDVVGATGRSHQVPLNEAQARFYRVVRALVGPMSAF